MKFLLLISFFMTLFSSDIEILHKGDEKKIYLIKGQKFDIETPLFIKHNKESGTKEVYLLKIHNKFMNIMVDIKKNSIVKKGLVENNKEAFVFMDASCSQCRNNIGSSDFIKRYSVVYFLVSDTKHTQDAIEIYSENNTTYDGVAIASIFARLGIKKVPIAMGYDGELVYMEKKD